MYEPWHRPLATKQAFLSRAVRSILLGVLLIGGSLFAGMLGYHHIGGLTWVEAYENAAMILSGMGPVADLPTDAAKIFAGTYALFSGVIFLVTIAVVAAPIVHRFMHRHFLVQTRD
ncbi:MAG: hypothetical protein ACOYKZ_02915 [Chlamydiia bacterium]